MVATGLAILLLVAASDLPAADADQDGRITAAEWSAYGYPDEKFRAADVDADGFVSPPELETWRRAVDAEIARQAAERRREEERRWAAPPPQPRER